jgi:DNA helicase-2/ATP-dependent DNA helicase PcrA
VKIILLEENYRSTQNILAVANEIIKKNNNRHEKNLFTQNQPGEKISLFAGLDENEEGDFVAVKCLELLDAGVPAENIAVLYRANFQSRVLEENFLQLHLPYEILGTKFYERKEIRDALAYLRLALNKDDAESLKRILNVPTRGLGAVTLEKVLAGEENSLPAKTQEKIKKFREILEDIKKTAVEKKPSETIKFIIQHTGLGESLSEDKETAKDRWENLQELVSLAVKYDDLPSENGLLQLLTETSLVSDQDALIAEKKGVRLSTVHAAKGLEFDYVFVTGLEQGLFPHSSFSTSDDSKDPEEERRLFYVALTRARKKVFLTYAQFRNIFGSRQANAPSEFIMDISDEFLMVEDGLDKINW